MLQQSSNSTDKMYYVDQLVKPMLHLINYSFITGLFPEQLETSKIKSLFTLFIKRVTEYICISKLSPCCDLTINISKIIEKAMQTHMQLHMLSPPHLFSDEQHDFGKKKSIVTALVNFTEFVIKKYIWSLEFSWTFIESF